MIPLFRSAACIALALVTSASESTADKSGRLLRREQDGDAGLPVLLKPSGHAGLTARSTDGGPSGGPRWARSTEWSRWATRKHDETEEDEENSEEEAQDTDMTVSGEEETSEEEAEHTEKPGHRSRRKSAGKSVVSTKGKSGKSAEVGGKVGVIDKHKDDNGIDDASKGSSVGEDATACDDCPRTSEGGKDSTGWRHVDSDASGTDDGVKDGELVGQKLQDVLDAPKSESFIEEGHVDPDDLPVDSDFTDAEDTDTSGLDVDATDTDILDAADAEEVREEKDLGTDTFSDDPDQMPPEPLTGSAAAAKL